MDRETGLVWERASQVTKPLHGLGGDYADKFIGPGGVCGERSPRDTHSIKLFLDLREGHVRRQLLRARAAALFEKSGQSADT